jgi:histidine ammonia-lyase
MAMTSVRNLRENLDRLETVLAVQFLMCAQGISLIQPQMHGLHMGVGTVRLLDKIRGTIEFKDADHYMTPDLEKAVHLVQDGELLDVTHQAQAHAAAA